MSVAPLTHRFPFFIRDKIVDFAVYLDKRSVNNGKAVECRCRTCARTASQESRRHTNADKHRSPVVSPGVGTISTPKAKCSSPAPRAKSSSPAPKFVLPKTPVRPRPIVYAIGTPQPVPSTPVSSARKRVLSPASPAQPQKTPKHE